MRIPCLLLSLVFAVSATAGEYNPVLSIGDVAPAWKNLPGTDGKQHSFDDLKDKAIVVVVFTCNSCPYAVDYEDRIARLVEKFCGPEGRTALVAINCNKIPEDSLEAMTARAAEKRFAYPYLFDETQQMARDYGAAYTPEFFVLNRERKVVYMGALDDHPDAAKAKVNHVAAAIEAALAGKEPTVKETPAVGCAVRFERRRSR